MALPARTSANAPLQLLGVALANFLEDRPERGRVFLAPFDVVFSFHDVVEPDVIFVAPDQLDILTDKNIVFVFLSNRVNSTDIERFLQMNVVMV